MATVANASEAGEAFADEFEKLVAQAATIADLVEEVRSAAMEFEQMVQASLAELDGDVADALQQATGWAEAAQGAVLELSREIDTLAHDVRGQIVQTTRSASTEIGSAIDQQAKAIDDGGKLAGEAVGMLNHGVQELLSGLRDRMGLVDQVWVAAYGANQEVHQQAKQAAQGFTARLNTAMDAARSAGETFAGELEDDVFVPIELVLHELDEEVRKVSTRLFYEGLSSLSASVEKTVRDEVSALVDEAIATVKDMINVKIDELLDRRDRSEPERKALEGIFDTLTNLLGAIEEKVGAVKEIRSIVGG